MKATKEKQKQQGRNLLKSESKVRLMITAIGWGIAAFLTICFHPYWRKSWLQKELDKCQK